MRVMFDDIQFFSSKAALQLAQVIAHLEAMQSGSVPSHDMQSSAMVLAGLCRMVDATLYDIRGIAGDLGRLQGNDALADKPASDHAACDVIDGTHLALLDVCKVPDCQLERSDAPEIRAPLRVAS